MLPLPAIAIEQGLTLKNLRCHGCKRHIVENGLLTCPRCHESVRIASSKDVAIDGEGRWQCQKCPEHGENPKTLAVDREIKCRFCDAKNSLFPQGGKTVAEAKTQETPRLYSPYPHSRITATQYRELLNERRGILRQWIPIFAERNADYLVDIHRRALSSVNQELKSPFDPDAIEQSLNVPLDFSDGLSLEGENMRFRLVILRRLGKSVISTQVVFYPLRREVCIRIGVTAESTDPAAAAATKEDEGTVAQQRFDRINGVHIVRSDIHKPIEHTLVFDRKNAVGEKGHRCIMIDDDGRVDILKI